MSKNKILNTNNAITVLKDGDPVVLSARLNFLDKITVEAAEKSTANINVKIPKQGLDEDQLNEILGRKLQNYPRNCVNASVTDANGEANYMSSVGDIAEVEWEQFPLTENGTLGQGYFAIKSKTEYIDEEDPSKSMPLWQMFDHNNSTAGCFQIDPEVIDSSFTMYFQNAIKMRELELTLDTSDDTLGYVTKIELYGSYTGVDDFQYLGEFDLFIPDYSYSYYYRDPDDGDVVVPPGWGPRSTVTITPQEYRVNGASMTTTNLGNGLLKKTLGISNPYRYFNYYKVVGKSASKSYSIQEIKIKGSYLSKLTDGFVPNYSIVNNSSNPTSIKVNDIGVASSFSLMQGISTDVNLAIKDGVEIITAFSLNNLEKESTLLEDLIPGAVSSSNYTLLFYVRNSKLYFCINRAGTELTGSGQTITGTTALGTNTKYYAKLYFSSEQTDTRPITTNYKVTLSLSTDKQNWTTQGTALFTEDGFWSTLKNYIPCLGGIRVSSTMNGQIFLKECSIKNILTGERIWDCTSYESVGSPQRLINQSQTDNYIESTSDNTQVIPSLNLTNGWNCRTGYQESADYNGRGWQGEDFILCNNICGPGPALYNTSIAANSKNTTIKFKFKPLSYSPTENWLNDYNSDSVTPNYTQVPIQSLIVTLASLSYPISPNRPIPVPGDSIDPRPSPYVENWPLTWLTSVPAFLADWSQNKIAIVYSNMASTESSQIQQEFQFDNTKYYNIEYHLTEDYCEVYLYEEGTNKPSTPTIKLDLGYNYTGTYKLYPYITIASQPVEYRGEYVNYTNGNLWLTSTPLKVAIQDLQTFDTKWVTSTNDVPWIQPILHSNTEIGTVSASSFQEGHEPYKALDNTNAITAGDENTSFLFNNETTGWWKWELPYVINVTAIEFYNANGTNNSIQGRFYTDEDMETPIGSAISTSSTAWDPIAVKDIPIVGIKTHAIYFNKTGGDPNAGIGEIRITATLNSDQLVFFDTTKPLIITNGNNITKDFAYIDPLPVHQHTYKQVTPFLTDTGTTATNDTSANKTNAWQAFASNGNYNPGTITPPNNTGVVRDVDIAPGTYVLGFNTYNTNIQSITLGLKTCDRPVLTDPAGNPSWAYISKEDMQFQLTFNDISTSYGFNVSSSWYRYLSAPFTLSENYSVMGIYINYVNGTSSAIDAVRLFKQDPTGEYVFVENPNNSSYSLISTTNKENINIGLDTSTGNPQVIDKVYVQPNTPEVEYVENFDILNAGSITTIDPVTHIMTCGVWGGAAVKESFNPGDKSWEITSCIKMLTANQTLNIVGANSKDKTTPLIAINPSNTDNKIWRYFTSNGSSWNMNYAAGNYVYPSTLPKLWVKLAFTNKGSVGDIYQSDNETGIIPDRYIIAYSLNGINYTIDQVVMNSTKLFQVNAGYTLNFGGNNTGGLNNTIPYLVYLDECSVKIDSKLWWTPYSVKPLKDNTLWMNTSSYPANTYLSYNNQWYINNDMVWLGFVQMLNGNINYFKENPLNFDPTTLRKIREIWKSQDSSAFYKMWYEFVKNQNRIRTWVEQGDIRGNLSGIDPLITINLFQPMSNPYNVRVQGGNANNVFRTVASTLQGNNPDNDNFKVWMWDRTNNLAISDYSYLDWKAEGYLLEDVDE